MGATVNELVSLIVPAYNASSTIVETLETVRAQAHPRLGAVVHDDGSTDDTAEDAASAGGGRRVRLVREPEAVALSPPSSATLH